MKGVRGGMLGKPSRQKLLYFILKHFGIFLKFLSKLLFFLVLYESSGLCGHAVIEKMQKILFLSYFLPIFDEQKRAVLNESWLNVLLSKSEVLSLSILESHITLEISL